MPPPLPGPSQTVADVLTAGLAGDPSKDALVGAGTRLSYEALDAEVDRAAQAWSRLVPPGERGAVSLPNHPDLVVAFLGAMRAGVVWVGVNRALAPPEKSFILDDADASVFVTDDLVDVSASLGRKNVPKAVSVEEWRDRVAAAPARPVGIEVDPTTAAAIAYTGGTTGFPKGVVHSQRNLVSLGAVNAATGFYSTSARHGVCLPLTTLNLLVLSPLLAFAMGAACVVLDGTDPETICKAVREERVGTLAVVPTILHRLLAEAPVEGPAEALPSLDRLSVGGAALPFGLRKEAEQRLGIAPVCGYGLTEAPSLVAAERLDGPAVEGATGTAVPHVALAIVDDEGRPLPPGEEGEIVVGPHADGPWSGTYTPMLGYWRRPEATADVMRAGVLRTGDVGHLDGAGNLFVTDRKTEVILRGGANVYPAEVERVLGAHPAVAACAVVGEPDVRLGERVVALVELRPGATAEPEELREHCRSGLALYKVPEDVRLVARLPRTAMGKVARSSLRR